MPESSAMLAAAFWGALKMKTKRWSLLLFRVTKAPQLHMGQTNTLQCSHVCEGPYPL